MGHVSSSGTTSHTLSLEVYPLKDMREGDVRYGACFYFGHHFTYSLTRSIPAEGHEGGGCKIWGMFLLRAPLHILSH